MNRPTCTPALLVTAALISVGVAVTGCNSHPDKTAAIYSALDKNDLSSVMVHQDRHSGVVTLSGIVTTPARKSKAEAVVQQSAPGYTISDQIQVKSLGS